MNGYDSGHSNGGHGRGGSDRGGFARGGPRGGFGRGNYRGGYRNRREECPAELRAPFKDARDFLAGLISAFGLPARLGFGGLEQARDGRQIVIDVRGLAPAGPPREYDRDHERDDELGLLIGKRGNMLDALTVVTNAVMHRVGDRELFFAVDVEGYRARRRATLRSIALRAAERALQDGVDVELEPMPASERRIVHMTLAAHRDLATESTGVGFDRRVVISARRGPRDRDAVDRGPRDRDYVDRGPRDRDVVDRAPRDRDVVDRGPRDRDVVDRGPIRPRERKPIRDDIGPPVEDRYAD
ncbi:MAG TPA: R3H domain-containing nucleic acid-binding protein [Candidatus Eremiobacteraceae bacterium]